MVSYFLENIFILINDRWVDKLKTNKNVEYDYQNYSSNQKLRNRPIMNNPAISLFALENIEDSVGWFLSLDNKFA